MTVNLSALDKLPAVPRRPAVERLRATLADNDQPQKVEKQRRAGRMREEVPLDPDSVKEARKLAVKRARLERQIAAVDLARHQAVLDMLHQGASLTEVAKILSVTKARVQQMRDDARTKYGLTPSDG